MAANSARRVDRQTGLVRMIGKPNFGALSSGWAKGLIGSVCGYWAIFGVKKQRRISGQKLEASPSPLRHDGASRRDRLSR
jgi:hypothetical protein